MRRLRGSVGEASAFGPGSWDQVPRQAPHSAGSLCLPLPLPAALPTCALFLCQINKILKKKKKKTYKQLWQGGKAY